MHSAISRKEWASVMRSMGLTSERGKIFIFDGNYTEKGGGRCQPATKKPMYDT
jgi:hypothetical protein